MKMVTVTCGACSLRSGTWHAAGLDGTEAEGAPVVGKRTAVAAKALLYRLRLCVLGACVLAAAVGLPDLDRGIVDRPAVAVEHPSLDAHALARNALRRQVLDHHPFQPDPQIWADRL
jgi:hypothetical protein